MLRRSHHATAAAICFLAAFVSSPLLAAEEAGAASSRIAVVDRNYVTRESAAAKDIRAQIEKKYQQYQAEIKNAQTALEQARDTLKQQSENLDAEEIKRRQSEIRQQANELSRVLQSRKSELDQMFNKGMQQIDDVLDGILKALAKERGINMIINAPKTRRIVLFIDENLVLTHEALTRLNEKLPSVDMVTLPVVGPPAVKKNK
jgi:outer membrane protein